MTDDDLGVDTDDSLSVTVANENPVIDSVLLSSAAIDENGFTTVSGSFSDIGSLDTHTVMINWGNGQSSPATVNPMDRTFSAIHQYLDDSPTITTSDTYTITITLTDDDLGVDTDDSLSVTVANKNPVIDSVLLSSAAIDETAPSRSAARSATSVRWTRTR